MKPYFKRVAAQSPTMFWINNPTQEQADLALENGALGCTNNPSYTQKMYDHPEYHAYTAVILDDVLAEFDDDRAAAIEFQARMVKPITDKFLPLLAWQTDTGQQRRKCPGTVRGHTGGLARADNGLPVPGTQAAVSGGH